MDISRQSQYPSGTKKKGKKPKNAVWWNLNLRALRSKVRALRRLYQKELDVNATQIKLINYKNLQAIYKRNILNSKRECFKGFVDRITTKNIYGKNFKILLDKTSRNRIFNPIKDDTGQLTKSLSDTMLKLIKHHFTYDLLATQTEVVYRKVRNSLEHKEILTQEVEEIISKIKLNKSPGPDNIPGELVKEMYYANRNWFTDLFKKLLKIGSFPTSWKTANVVFLPKEKKDLSLAEHYRPICLLSSWGKTFDKLIAKRIVYHLELNNFFNSNQFGFRRKKSTITAIQNIKSFVNQASDENKMVCLISLDIKNAFNSVNWNLLKSKISKLPIPSYLIQILFDFLNNRCVLYEGEKISYNQGIPQGSCLGPILWNIFINDLLDLKLESESVIQAFADDIILMLKDRVSYLFRDNSKKHLEMIFNWTQANMISDPKLLPLIWFLCLYRSGLLSQPRPEVPDTKVGRQYTKINLPTDEDGEIIVFEPHRLLSCPESPENSNQSA
ncbi:probable RNA-directed DNA polymerase from transposon BS [Caerostris darwini]|uniref:Probable RNA-directed DNA polymerase from transposon BS n=1 Tax=Caerostris darwini TaxID=1538125 RepID=A0AAV4TM73_9ARAC|nr:probable RNA-directed DNA polymerase from transposon BS [Caerostris darwini]